MRNHALESVRRAIADEIASADVDVQLGALYTRIGEDGGFDGLALGALADRLASRRSGLLRLQEQVERALGEHAQIAQMEVLR